MGVQFWLISILTLTFCIALHILIRVRFPNSDPLIFPIAVALNGIGLVQISRIDSAQLRVWGDEYTPALRMQFVWSVLGILTMMLVLLVFKNHKTLRRLIWTTMFFGLLLMVLPLFPVIGLEVNGARAWVKLGPLGTFQPAEFAKVLFAIFFAGYLTINLDRLKLAGKKVLFVQLPRMKDLGPLLLIWLTSLVILVLQHDLGTSLLLFGIFLVELYLATGKASWVAIGFGLFALGATLALRTFSHVASRVDVWLDPFNPDIYNREFGGSGQVVQGFFALSNGGLFGKGLGFGYPTLTPFSNSDFIYTALGEELGLTGLMAILLIYLILVERGLSMSLQVKDTFGKLLASGIAFAIALQVFVVVGGLTKIIPLTGLTLPFIARGGSSLIANWALLGLLILVSNSRESRDSWREDNIMRGELNVT
jgi:cell division protein FtsW (lipid II flippase)